MLILTNCKHGRTFLFGNHNWFILECLAVNHAKCPDRLISGRTASIGYSGMSKASQSLIHRLWLAIKPFLTVVLSPSAPGPGDW